MNNYFFGFGLISFFVLSIEDIRKQKIGLCEVMAIGSIVLIVSLIINGGYFVVMGALPGVILFIIELIINKLLRIRFAGLGDYAGMIIIGMLLGSYHVLMAFFMAFFLFVLWALILSMFEGITRNTKTAFIPFLLCGYVGAMCI